MENNTNKKNEQENRNFKEEPITKVIDKSKLNSTAEKVNNEDIEQYSKDKTDNYNDTDPKRDLNLDKKDHNQDNDQDSEDDNSNTERQ
jgi:hypothetical protein